MSRARRGALAWLVPAALLAAAAAGCGGEGGPSAGADAGARPGPWLPPDAAGPHPVGVRRALFVDPDRFHAYGDSFRALPTTLWYPALAGSGRPNTLGDFMGELPEWAAERLEEMLGGSFSGIETLRTSALRDAALDRAGAPYPVVLFSHGVSSNGFQSWDQCEHLASHGFIVAAPDHYGSALVTVLEDNVVFFHPMAIFTDLRDRPADVPFLFRELGRVNADPGHFLHQGMDLSRFGVMGHSWGGFTCMAAAARHEFVRALAVLAPIVVWPFPEGFGRPFFLLQSDTDDICDASMDSNRRAYEAWSGCRADPGICVRLLNAGHFSPSNVCDLMAAAPGPDGARKAATPRLGCEPGFMDVDRANRIAGAYLAAFFKAALAGDPRYRRFLEENRFPGEMDLFRKDGP